MREGRPGIEDVEGGGGVGDLKLQGSDRRLTLQGVECTGREMERKGEEREKIEGGRQVDRYRTDSTDSLDHGVLVLILILILAQPALGAEEESKARQYQSRRRKQKGWRQGCLIHCPERRRMAARPRMVSQAKLELELEHGQDVAWRSHSHSHSHSQQHTSRFLPQPNRTATARSCCDFLVAGSGCNQPPGGSWGWLHTVLDARQGRRPTRQPGRQIGCGVWQTLQHNTTHARSLVG